MAFHPAMLAGLYCSLSSMTGKGGEFQTRAEILLRAQFTSRPRKKALHGVCPRCYIPPRFTEKAEAAPASESLHYEPMRATKEITD